MSVSEIKIGNRVIGEFKPTYFIADIAANHDGDLDRAKMLCKLAKEAGADAAKFQNFHAKKIVSDFGFKSMSGQVSHQAKWKKSVVEVYDDASVPDDWTVELKNYCDSLGIEYFSAPYDFEAIDLLEPYVPAYKVGSGDITWLEALEKMAKKNKPVILSTGASNIGDVQRAVDHILKFNKNLILLQCNTNYTGSLENFKYINLNVLKTYRSMYPNLIIGLSDHTPGLATTLGAVTLGARVIEKHFTDDKSRTGPDHPFSMNPTEWKDMVDRTRELENALGSANKDIAGNETETVIIQRRCLRAAKDIKSGEVLTRQMIDVLRPATIGAILPYEIDQVIGLKANEDIKSGQELRWSQLVKN